MIAVVLTSRLTEAFTDPGLVTILHGLAGQLSYAGRALLLVPTSAAQSTFPVRHAIADAFVLCDLVAEDPAVTDALDRHIPVVTIGHPRLPGVPMVGIDNRRAAAMAAEHLLELGHRRFCLLTISEENDSGAPGRHVSRPSIPLRSAGFTDTLRRAAANTITAAAAVMAGVLAQPPQERRTGA